MDAISPITMRRQLGASNLAHGNSRRASTEIADSRPVMQADIAQGSIAATEPANHAVQPTAPDIHRGDIHERMDQSGAGKSKLTRLGRELLRFKASAS